MMLFVAAAIRCFCAVRKSPLDGSLEIPSMTVSAPSASARFPCAFAYRSATCRTAPSSSPPSATNFSVGILVFWYSSGYVVCPAMLEMPAAVPLVSRKCFACRTKSLRERFTSTSSSARTTRAPAQIASSSRVTIGDAFILRNDRPDGRRAASATAGG